MFRIFSTENHGITELRRMMSQGILLHAKIILEILGLFVVFEVKPSITASLEPLQSRVVATADLSLQLRVGCADFGDGMAGREAVLLKALINGLLLFLQLADVFDCTLQNGALVLVAVGHEVRDAIDSFVDSLTATTFH